jgi:molecular chaperone GrpE
VAAGAGRLENLKKRSCQGRQDAVRFGNESLLRDLLPVIDNLERPSARRAAGNGKSLVGRGPRRRRSRRSSATASSGWPPPAGSTAVHEAVAYVESPSHDAQQVIEEHQAGYRLNERLLRPAMVTVSKGRPGPKNLANDEGGG